MKKKMIAGLMMVVMLLVLLPTNVAQAATYQKGNRNGGVTNLQRNLTFLGFSTKGVDGSFGNNTKNAVIALQKALHMKQTGSVDDKLDALIIDTVYDIQLYMKLKGYYKITVDGIGGNGTTNAMKAYQKAYGYAQTGIADLSILKAMLQDSAVKQHLGALEEYVARMEGTYVEKKQDAAYWKAYGEYAQQKIDELLGKLGVTAGKTVYFTANGKSCTSKWVKGHGVYGCNCCLSQILKSNPDGWFEKTFGKVNPDNLPDHTSFSADQRSSGGQSCFGWCNFAMWYLFKTADSPDVRAELAVEPGVFTKEYLQKNVKPGDVLRLNYTHSVLVYAVREDGIEIIDSNSVLVAGQTNCAINKWVMSYDNKNFKNKPVCINRVKYFDDSLLNTTEVYTTTDASVLADARYQVIKTEEITEYGYKEMEFSSGTTPAKDGWILTGEVTDGSVLVDWTEQVLTAGAGEEVITRQIEKNVEKTVYQYSNYYWYTTAGATNLSSRSWAEKYGRTYNKTVTKAWDYSGLTKSNYKYNVLYSKDYDTPLEQITAPGGTPYVDESDFQWWQEDQKTVTTKVLVTEYCKLVNTTSYQFFRWTEEKGWRTDSPYTATDTCKPVTRTVTTYYYIKK